MKFRFLFIALAILVLVAWASYPIAARWKQNERRRAMMDVPQGERPLRVPTQQRLVAAFPDGSLNILKQSRKLVVFSIKPRENFGNVKHSFHDHEILGQTTLTEANAKSALLSSLYDGLVTAKNDNFNNIALGCFNPRHGIRASHNGKTVDLLICFSCHQFNAYQNNKEVDNGFINNYPQPTLNKILTTANIPISR